MCGLVGHISREGEKPDVSGFERAMQAVSDRGPDDSGVYAEDHIVLGHRRLGIIDPSHNAQPLLSPCGRYVIVYNGEVYNYKEIATYLASNDISLEHNNDTSVLLALYILEKEQCLHRLNGMFAFAVWDRKERTFFAARDRLGEKPFYYALFGNQLYFGSTVAAVRQFDLPKLTVLESRVAEYFAHQYIVTDSIYKEINRLAPGHYLMFSPQTGLRVNSYWQLSAIEPNHDSKPHAIEKIRSLIDDSVKLRLRSDVPLGIFLSGGVDSSIITSQAAKHLDHINTFCAGFDEQSYDESLLASKAAAHYATVHHNFIISSSPADLVGVIGDIVRVVGEPFADPAMVPTWQLCKLAAKEVKVVLSGDGADEIFGGYRRYYAAKYGLLLSKSSFLSNGLDFLAKLLPDTGKYFSKSLAKKIILLNNYISHHKHFPGDRLPRVYSTQELIQLIDGKHHSSQMNLSDFAFAKTELQKHQVTDLQSYLPDNILLKTDRISMHFGLEVRTPFLDHRIVENAIYYPDAYKISLRNQKLILKDAFRKELVPQIIKSPKHGFAAPLYRWLQGPLVPVIHCALADKELSDYVNLAYVKELWEQHSRGFRDNSRQLWTLIVFYIWLQQGVH